MSVNIQLEWTPNPSTLKYVVDRRLLSSGAVNFTRREEAEQKSPLARKLMDIQGVTAVMLGLNFVTVTKGDEGEWDELNDAVMSTLDAHLGSDEPVVDEAAVAAARAAPAEGGSSVEQRIREILDAEIRPAVAQDGGDITLDRYENGVVYLHMQGSCSGCPSSTATLKMGIEGRLREAIPEVTEVVSI
ncbi:NifU family protein [Stigmatella aurantiaca]|uniref:NIF system FeS cluster assembly, NifU family protein n=1 Tax=Stigmatella aurantiaca (strain DW4/3-1) TaxID=378806 RepID=Q08XV4_STIAD|nr:NifU family protein [Stigmatella aurantiaca]ADO74453.1 NIF system FeS cluster assembly, NifU family protein [Stigmatella aurantiaca DW4/3-1]EAU65308.1 NifU domain protein [Stigmatella aurantiaca DW4/3-1]